MRTGFCDTCGRKPAPTAGAQPNPATRRTAAIKPAPDTERTSRRYDSGRWGGSAVVSLPMVEQDDPADRIFSQLHFPEQNRICGNDICLEPVGRSHDGQRALDEGYCPRCGTPFSFYPKLNPGDLVSGQYEVLGCFASGGQGWVYLARDRRLDDNYVALKGLINPKDTRAVQLAAAERQALTRLDHRNIVRIFNFVDHPDPRTAEPIDYIVMEYVGGLSLAEIHDRARRQAGRQDEWLRVEHVIAYGQEILAALDYLHGEGMLYCDMKPANVIHGGNRIKVIDLGAVRRIGVDRGPTAWTEGYQVGKDEIHRYGLTVRSDVHTVGKTLQDLLEVSADRVGPSRQDPGQQDAEQGDGDISFGVESLRLVLERAVAPYEQRFATAAELSDQLEGVRREILSLRVGTPNPAPSAIFGETPALLDAGLGAVPNLDRWTITGASVRNPVTARPTAPEAVTCLPAPRVALDDPAASALIAMREPDSRRLLAKLGALSQQSVEVQFATARAHLEVGDLGGATRCLDAACRLLGAHAPDDWRVAWHGGLLALARGDAMAARSQFWKVYAALPGEEAPKLALGFCDESLGDPRRAEQCYQAVWLRDRLQVSAAFGLVRLLLDRADRAGAVAVLDQVPQVSRHYDAAMIAAVRVLSARLPKGPLSADEFSRAVERLPALYLDGGEARDRLTAVVQEAALDWFHLTGGTGTVAGEEILGEPVSERGLFLRLERSFRRLARQARSAEDHGVLIDQANAARPRTLW